MCITLELIKELYYDARPNKSQELHSLFHLQTALHVSGGSTTHHQERKQLCLKHLVLVRPLLLSATVVEEWQIAITASQIPNAVDTVVCAPDDG